MEYKENDPRRLFAVLAENYAPTGGEFVASLRRQGYSDADIVDIYQTWVKPATCEADFLYAMQRWIDAEN